MLQFELLSEKDSFIENDCMVSAMLVNRLSNIVLELTQQQVKLKKSSFNR